MRGEVVQRYTQGHRNVARPPLALFYYSAVHILGHTYIDIIITTIAPTLHNGA